MILGTVQWLADKLLQRNRDQKADSRNKAADLKEKRDRVANYFGEIASTLEKMLEKFRAKSIPRIEGNKLEVLLSDFDRIVHSIYDKTQESERQAVFDALADLYRTADRAKEEDFLMIGIGYFDDDQGSGPREHFLADLERIIGRYQGLAVSLRAIALE